MQVLSLIPNIVSSGGVLLGGIYWLTHRKAAAARVARAERAEVLAERRKS